MLLTVPLVFLQEFLLLLHVDHSHIAQKIWFLLSCLQALAVAVFYARGVIRRREKKFPGKLIDSHDLGPKGEWRHTFCNYAEEVEYCAQSLICCCLWARVGDTFSTTEVCGFWEAQAVCLLAQFLRFAFFALGYQDLSDPGTIGICFGIEGLLALWLASKRRRLRQRLGQAHPTGIDAICDWMGYFFCTHCMVVQDARQVDEAINTRVECCCRLVHTKVPGGPAVGTAVEVAEVLHASSAASSNPSSQAGLRSRGRKEQE